MWLYETPGLYLAGVEDRTLIGQEAMKESPGPSDLNLQERSPGAT